MKKMNKTTNELMIDSENFETRPQKIFSKQVDKTRATTVQILRAAKDLEIEKKLLNAIDSDSVLKIFFNSLNNISRKNPELFEFAISLENGNKNKANKFLDELFEIAKTK